MEIGLCEIVSALAFIASILLIVVIICHKNNFEGYLPAWKDTKLMTGTSWNRLSVHNKNKDWDPIGLAALVPLFGNVLKYDYILEKRVDRGTGSCEYFYRVRRIDGTVTLPIVESRELTDGTIVSIANASNPYADRMLIKLIKDKPQNNNSIQEADIINFP